MVIGVDLDNTIIDYRGVFAALARESSWTLTSAPDKRAFRDQLRSRPGGEDEWQRAQAQAYGPRIMEADLFDGVAAFFTECRRRQVPAFILSHKTRWAGARQDGVDLHEAARAFMRHRGFFDPLGLGLPPGSVSFAECRQEKLANIAKIGCTHFIDDLVETFMEPDFPPGVVRILFSVDPPPACLPDLQWTRTWHEIHEYFFQQPAVGSQSA